jgi:hypothetical protein
MERENPMKREQVSVMMHDIATSDNQLVAIALREFAANQITRLRSAIVRGCPSEFLRDEIGNTIRAVAIAEEHEAGSVRA